MDKKLSFGEKLDFSDIDLTAPDKVIEEILLQLPEETRGIIRGEIQPYGGRVYSYTKTSFSGIAQALGSVEKTVSIQNDLGGIGQNVSKFECFLFTPEYDAYKYRVFFIKYGIANYPVDVILDESIARSISDTLVRDVYTCNTREELENLIYNIFNSKRMVTVMQELIRINQAKRIEKASLETEDSDDGE
ncbi:hypothetical protein [Anaerotignum lactatifermentans]|uniref:hypothetical protein n=1 Tax=Anaerotignum lactatifermentans TaxID=160404 RepID=UPI001874A07B|nr:hypothetical protein [Anaerotignum lactatifermentans]MBE5075371.1 hypothetical protein [Anaerotignum lactatifermentans]